jgi:hypothetical protein
MSILLAAIAEVEDEQKKPGGCGKILSRRR